MPKTKKANVAAPEEQATPKQLWTLFLLTRKDWRDKGISKAEASERIGSLMFESQTARLRKGVPVSTTFEADAKRLFDWTRKNAPSVRCVLKGKAWTFTPVGATSDGFPTR
jgi:hypothetical protein